MNSRLAGIFSIAVMLGVSGCASMSADECAMSDWRTIGFEDGDKGIQRIALAIIAKLVRNMVWPRTLRLTSPVEVKAYVNIASRRVALTLAPVVADTTVFVQETWSRTSSMHSIRGTNSITFGQV